jgi:triosephosphate isomerase (TIM)
MSFLLVANWKLHPVSAKEARSLFTSVYEKTKNIKKVECVVCPPPLLLGAVSEIKGKKKRPFLGAQDCFYEKEGAHTGESSPYTLASFGVSYCLIGHSERRAYADTDDIVQKKVASALSHSLIPILCVGEKERSEEGEYYRIVQNQVLSALSSVKRADLSSIVLAYEPVWAIGKSENEALSPSSLFEMILFIRKILIEKYGRNTAKNVKILYGGSVKEDNARAFCEEGGGDGLLIGRTSLSASSFASIALSLSSVKK